MNDVTAKSEYVMVKVYDNYIHTTRKGKHIKTLKTTDNTNALLWEISGKKALAVDNNGRSGYEIGAAFFITDEDFLQLIALDEKGSNCDELAKSLQEYYI